MRPVPRPARPVRRPRLNRRSRLAAALVAAAALAAACGGDGSDDAVNTTTTTTTPTAPVTAGGAPAPPTTSDVVPPDAPSPTPPVGVGSPPPSEVVPTPVPAPTGAPLVVGNVGSLATAYLRAEGPATLLVEVRSQAGGGPRSGAVDRIAALLREVSGKPVSVVVGSVPGGEQEWTGDQLRALADQGTPQSPDRAVLRLLFLDGGFAENDAAVGVAVRGDVAAVFAPRIDQAAGPFGNPAAVEDAVAMHEVGHLLGLVDLVIDTGRDDPEHPGHSTNPGSVMYHAVESTLLGTLLQGGPPRDFDAADLADLARIRDA